jgi:hypothetical protein
MCLHVTILHKYCTSVLFCLALFITTEPEVPCSTWTHMLTDPRYRCKVPSSDIPYNDILIIPTAINNQIPKIVPGTLL